MSWLDTIRNRAQEAKGTAPAAPAEPKPVRPAKPRAKREIKVAWFTTATPKGDLGAVECVHYFVADGSVTLCDESGKPTKKTAPLPEGADPKKIAGRMGRAAWLASDAGNDFNRPIRYGSLGPP